MNSQEGDFTLPRAGYPGALTRRTSPRDARRANPWTTGLCLGLVTLVLSACGDGRNAQEHLSSAEQLLQAGDTQGGLIELRNAVQKEPENAEARWRLGTQYLESGDAAAAVKELTRALELGIEQADAETRLVEALLRQGRFDEALERIENQGPPQTAEAAVTYGRVLTSVGRPDEAIAAYQNAREIDPNSVDALHGLASIALGQGDPDAARRYLADGLAIEPGNGALLYLQGELELSGGDLSAAETAFIAARQDPDMQLAALLGIARSQLAAENPQAAVKAVEQARELSPFHPLASYLYGLAKYQLGESDEARAAFEQVLSINPDHPGSLQMLGALQYEAEQYGQADASLSKLMSLTPDNILGVRLLAATRLQSGRVHDAIRVLERVVDETDDVAVLMLASTAYQRTGDLESSRRYLERAAELSPDTPTISARLGLTHLLAGNAAQALEEFESVGETEEFRHQSRVFIAVTHLQNRDFEQALAIADELIAEAPDNAFAHNIAGSAQVGLGNTAEAKKRFASALEIDPRFTPASLNLARVAASEGDLDESERILKKILEYAPNHETTLMNLARIAGAREDPEALRDYLEQARSGDTKALQARLALSRYYRLAGEQESALAVAEEAVTENPGDPRALYSLAQVRAAQRDRDGVLDALTRIDTAQVQSASLLTQIANLFRGVGEPDQAAPVLEAALERDTNYFPALMSMAQIELGRRNFDKTLELSRKIVDLAPDSPEGPAIQADVAAVQGDYEKAASLYRDALDLKPTQTLATKLHQTLVAADRVDEALAMLEDWVAQNPDHDSARFTFATSLMQAERLDAARAEFETLVKRTPQNAAALNNLAWVYYRLNDSKAVETAEQALAAAPESATILDTAGWILAETGDIRQGLDYLKRAHDKLPENPSVTYHYLATLAKSGEPRQAAERLDELLSTYPAFPEREEALALHNSLGSITPED